MMEARIPLHRAESDTWREIVRAGAANPLVAAIRRNRFGVDILSLSHHEGWVDVLPCMGAMVWNACFHGVALGMRGHLPEPRPATGILGTYGCLLYHAGLLRNGNPGPGDDHPLHGEAPCAPMDDAALVVREDATGPCLSLECTRHHALGFGPHYRAVHTVTLRPGATEFEVATEVTNRAGKPMDLMYMVHANFAFLPGATILQPAPWTPEHVRVRTAMPSHVVASPAFLARLETLARDPGSARVLDAALCDPEQVFYLHGLRTDASGWAHLALRQPRGDGFALSYRPQEFPHLVRWLYASPDEQVAAFALPSTCEPEGFTAERRKGNVQSVAPGETRRFAVRFGYLGAGAMAERARLIEAS
jgi:hypothetical protein